MSRSRALSHQDVYLLSDHLRQLLPLVGVRIQQRRRPGPALNYPQGGRQLADISTGPWGCRPGSRGGGGGSRRGGRGRGCWHRGPGARSLCGCCRLAGPPSEGCGGPEWKVILFCLLQIYFIFYLKLFVIQFTAAQ